MGAGNSIPWAVYADEKRKQEIMRNEKSVQLKVFVDEKNKKVMFAEADATFVEILFSFFTLPLGTIARLSTIQANSKCVKLGSLSSLYESVVKLNVQHFNENWYKNSLGNPKNSSAPVCQKLKVNLDEKKPISTSVPNVTDDVVFFKKRTNFIITDDLKVVPVVLDTSIALLTSLGVEYIDSLEERTMHFGLEEFSNLLKWSLLTSNPLTNVVFGGSKPSSSLFTNSTFVSTNSSQTPTVKLLVKNSTNTVLCAQVEDSFLELLFSFLTIPLGAYLHLTKDSSSPVGISNLYDSITSLEERNYLKSEDVKTMLLCPKVAAIYHRATDLLPIYEVDTQQGRFLKEQGTVIVSDDLKITAYPSIAAISKFNTPGVPIGDMEVIELSIGEREAIFLLKASLTSTSALTDCLRAFRKKPKDHVPNIAFGEDGGRCSQQKAESTLEEKSVTDASFILFD